MRGLIFMKFHCRAAAGLIGFKLAKLTLVRKLRANDFGKTEGIPLTDMRPAYRPTRLFIRDLQNLR